MRIKNNYSAESSPSFVSFLIQKGISYKLSNSFSPPIIQFSLYDDDIRKKDVDEQLTGWNMVVPELLFSKSEYENASWYRFMPKYDKIPSCESHLTYSYFCENANGCVDYNSIHRRQIGYYRLNKAYNWPNNKCILSSEGDHNHMWFSNDTTRELLETADICGLRFDPVINEHDGQTLSNIHQIVFTKSIPEDALALGKEYGIKSVVSCTNCGEKRYYVSPQTYQLCLYEESLGDEDIYLTQAVFGQGFGYRMVIGSQKFYQVIKESNLVQHFKIHPIRTI